MRVKSAKKIDARGMATHFKRLVVRLQKVPPEDAAAHDDPLAEQPGNLRSISALPEAHARAHARAHTAAEAKAHAAS